MYRLAVLLVVIFGALRARDITGTISGVVSDSSAAVVPGATVQVVNSTTNVRAWSGVSDRQGAFLAPVLPAGSYDITVEATASRSSKFAPSRSNSTSAPASTPS